MRPNQQRLGPGLVFRHTALKGQTSDAAPMASANEALPATSGQTHSIQSQSQDPPS